jgi:hypothetical protein
MATPLSCNCTAAQPAGGQSACSSRIIIRKVFTLQSSPVDFTLAFRRVCFFVRPHGTSWLPLDGFELFSKICGENSSLIKIQEEERVLYVKTFLTFMTPSRWILFKVRNVSNGSCRENQNTTCTLIIIFRKSYRLWDNVEKFGRDRAVALHARLVKLYDPQTHAHARTEACNTYCFSTATVVSRTRLIVTLHVHCLSWFCCL